MKQFGILAVPLDMIIEKIEKNSCVECGNFLFRSISPQVSGVLSNTGHSVAFRISDVQPSNPINISGGPLSYKYRFHELHLHYGRTDDRGSEHTVSGTAFPGERDAVWELFGDLSTASGTTVSTETVFRRLEKKAPYALRPMVLVCFITSQKATRLSWC
ncbi:hypothetical protein CDAR_456751 [Caerostris darwini]|uniref:Alpha-carbonic anhydrase domain-containing protein n=1 Tax=Caerostris darwini TaxID=1538125 RepID=A0AAV4TRI6_9ARAC|nr:hypothetical protein CDAR_456751 [Caerostris darwini]